MQYFTLIVNIEIESYSNYSVSKINERHELLGRTIGTTLDEDKSYMIANNLNLTCTICIFSFMLLEGIFYYVYSNKVRIKNISAKYQQTIFLCFIFSGSSMDQYCQGMNTADSNAMISELV